jgi:hypothetical protein
VGAFVVDKQDEENPVQARIRVALQSDIPNITFNGMVTSLGTGDVLVVLERNGHPVAVLNVSYTVAKTLSMLLGNTIAKLEELSGHPIMTTTEIERSLTVSIVEEKSHPDSFRFAEVVSGIGDVEADAQRQKEAKQTPKS